MSGTAFLHLLTGTELAWLVRYWGRRLCFLMFCVWGKCPTVVTVLVARGQPCGKLLSLCPSCGLSGSIWLATERKWMLNWTNFQDVASRLCSCPYVPSPHWHASTQQCLLNVMWGYYIQSGSSPYKQQPRNGGGGQDMGFNGGWTSWHNHIMHPSHQMLSRRCIKDHFAFRFHFLKNKLHLYPALPPRSSRWCTW